MSAASEAPINLRRYDRRTTRDQTRQSGWRHQIWTFANSSLGLWFLSSVVLGTAVYFYQTWQDEKHQQEITAQKVERLNLEIAGRVSQFGTWARVNLVRSDDRGYQFQVGTDETKIKKAIEYLADIPQFCKDTNTLCIHEMFSEFRKRNLISLYAELDLIARKSLEQSCHCNIDKSHTKLDAIGLEEKLSTPISAIMRRQSHLGDNDLHQLYIKTMQYREAEVALLSPDYLIQYAVIPDHDTFIRSFEGIFLTEDIKSSRLPSTDCLENLWNGGGCITYPEPNQSDDTQSADGLGLRVFDIGYRLSEIS
jgi:hypothetical protein